MTQRVLITDWGDGTRFFHGLEEDSLGVRRPSAAQYPASLSTLTLPVRHVVVLCKEPPAVEPLKTWLGEQAWGINEGFHRFDLGALQLTLCVGEPLTQLQQCEGVFDEIDASHIDKWWAKALARVSREGTVLRGLTSVAPTYSDLRSAGFVPAETHWVYQPAWIPKRRKNVASLGAVNAASAVDTSVAVTEPLDVAVIGAGLAGASVAAALARRGHRVTVLDAASSPAQAASGLPAGLMAPLLSLDDNPRSRLVRAGLRLTHQALMRFAQSGAMQAGVDHGLGGLLQMGASLPGAHGPALDWSRPHAQGVWHPSAAWVRASALVQAWLGTPGIEFAGDARVHKLQPLQASKTGNHGWALLDAQGHELARAHRVVLANALGSLPLLAPINPDMAHTLSQVMSGMSGQITLGPQPIATSETTPHLTNPPTQPPSHPLQTAWPTHPINGNGALIPDLPMTDPTTGRHAKVWAFGATYEATPVSNEKDAQNAPLDVQAHHQRNLEKFAALLPDLYASVFPPGLKEPARRGLHHWQGQRAVTTDRLPLLGPMDPQQTLWLCAGLGSRGLTLAALCAEQLAAAWHQEPGALPRELSRLLAADRFKTK